MVMELEPPQARLPPSLDKAFKQPFISVGLDGAFSLHMLSHSSAACD